MPSGCWVSLDGSRNRGNLGNGPNSTPAGWRRGCPPSAPRGKTVRLNVAKTLAWLGDKRAIEPVASILAQAKSEAEYGYSGTFKDEEYADPAPRWRQGFLRALGLLGAHEHTDLIVRILEDEGSVMEIRHAAAEALWVTARHNLPLNERPEIIRSIAPALWRGTL